MDLGKFAIGFVCGAAIGAAVSYFVFKEKFKADAEEEISEMRDYVKEKLGERSDLKKQGEKLEEQGKKLEKVVRSYDTFSKLPVDRESEVTIRRAEMEHPKEDKEIYRISHEEYVDVLPEFDKITLTYYSDDATLVDEVDEIVDIGTTIGTDNFKAFDANDLDEMYVRNEKMSCDYEVVRVLGSYKEMIGDI